MEFQMFLISHFISWLVFLEKFYAGVLTCFQIERHLFQILLHKNIKKVFQI